MEETNVDLKEELRSADLQAITVAAAESQAKNAVAITAPSTPAAPRSIHALASLAPSILAHPSIRAVNHLAQIDPTADLDQAVVGVSSGAVVADLGQDRT